MLKQELIENIEYLYHRLNDSDSFKPTQVKRLTKVQLTEVLDSLLTRCYAKNIKLVSPLCCNLYRDPVLGIDPRMPKTLETRYFPRKLVKDRDQAEKLIAMFSAVGFKTTSGDHVTGSLAATVLKKLWHTNPNKLDVKAGIYSYPALIKVAKQITYVQGKPIKTKSGKLKTESIPISLPEDQEFFILDEAGDRVFNHEAILDVTWFRSGFEARQTKVIDLRDQNVRKVPHKGKVKKKLTWGTSDPRVELKRDQYRQHLTTVNKASYHLIVDLNTTILSIEVHRRDQAVKTYCIGSVNLIRQDGNIIQPLADLETSKIARFTNLTDNKLTVEAIAAALNKVWHDNAKDTTSQSIHFDRFLTVYANTKCLFSDTEWQRLKRYSRKIMFTLLDRGMLKDLEFTPVVNSMIQYRHLNDQGKLSQKDQRNFNNGISMYVNRNARLLRALWEQSKDLGDFPSLPKPRD